MRTHAHHAPIDLIADEDPQTINEPCNIKIAAYGILDGVIKRCIGAPEINGEGIKNMSV